MYIITFDFNCKFHFVMVNLQGFVVTRKPPKRLDLAVVLAPAPQGAKYITVTQYTSPSGVNA